jgi:hypothetical protein
MHAVDVRVNDFAADEKRHFKIGVERDLNPEHSVSIQNLSRFMFDPQPNTTPTKIHQRRGKIRTHGRDHGIGGQAAEIRTLPLIECRPGERDGPLGGKHRLWIQERPGGDLGKFEIPGVETRDPSLTAPDIFGKTETQ